jgi:Gly-Xaa carboxypeptidase
LRTDSLTCYWASSVGAVKEHDSKLLAGLADKFNLSYTAFGNKISTEGQDAPSWGTLTLTDAWGTALEPAPVTPIDDAPYKLLSGTIKTTYAAHRKLQFNADAIAVAPGIMTGNTGMDCLSRLHEGAPSDI